MVWTQPIFRVTEGIKDMASRTLPNGPSYTSGLRVLLAKRNEGKGKKKTYFLPFFCHRELALDSGNGSWLIDTFIFADHRSSFCSRTQPHTLCDCAFASAAVGLSAILTPSGGGEACELVALFELLPSMCYQKCVQTLDLKQRKNRLNKKRKGISVRFR